MKQGVDESYAPGVRLDEWEDDGSEAFDKLFKQLQESDWPVWETKDRTYAAPFAGEVLKPRQRCAGPRYSWEIA